MEEENDTGIDILGMRWEGLEKMLVYCADLCKMISQMSKREKAAPVRLGCLTRAVGNTKEVEFSLCKIMVFLVKERKGGTQKTIIEER